MDGTLQALLDLSMMTLEPCNNTISLVKVSKRREETIEFQSSLKFVMCKTMRKPLHKNIRSSVFENKKQKRASIQLSIVGYSPISQKQSTSKQVNNCKCLLYVF